MNLYDTQDHDTTVVNGWECPRCGNIYSPSVVKCEECSQVEVDRPIEPSKELLLG